MFALFIVPIVNTEVRPSFILLNSPMMSVLRVMPVVANPSVTNKVTTGRPGVRVTCDSGLSEFMMSVSPSEFIPSMKRFAFSNALGSGETQSSKQNSALSLNRTMLKRSFG